MILAFSPPYHVHDCRSPRIFLAITHFPVRFDQTGAMLCKWLGSGPSKIPAFATHKVGVAGMVIRPPGEVLVVREARGVDGRRTGFGRGWKLPGGLSDLGEDLGVTAEREVFEETGIRAK